MPPVAPPPRNRVLSAMFRQEGSVILGPQVDRLPESDRADYVHEVASRLGEPLVDYVRLNDDARRG